MATSYQILIMGLLSSLFSGCSRQPSVPHPTSSTSAVLKIAVFQDGHFTVDDKNSSLAELRDSLKQLSDKKGMVWYYREAADQEPPQIGKDVLQAIIAERLPIRMSARPDFSDYVDEQGASTTAPKP